MKKQQQIEIFDAWGKKLKDDRKINHTEHRRQLLLEARGKVLEVAVGTGANFAFYPRDVEITAVDFSPVLLAKARRAAAAAGFAAEFVEADVEELSFADASFDTIVSTMSFCAYEEPGKVLQNFNRWCKPGGRILLFEHGLTNRAWLDFLLQQFERWHYRHYGCHVNLDIRELLGASGLFLEEVRQVKLAGYLIRAKPNKDMVPQGA